MDALSYEQIAEAMETTVPSIKSLLVRARVSLAEAAEARLLSCDEVRIELGEVAEGLRRRPTPLVRRHLRACERCSTFRVQLKETNKALAAIMPLGPLVLLKKLFVTHLSHSAGSSATSAGAGAAGSTAAAGSGFVAGSTAGGFVSAGMGAIATKAAAGLAAAALVTAGAVEVDKSGKSHAHSHSVASLPAVSHTTPVTHAIYHSRALVAQHVVRTKAKRAVAHHNSTPPQKHTLLASVAVKAAAKPAAKPAAPTTTATTPTKPASPAAPASAPGRTQTQSDPTILSPAQATTTTVETPATTTPATPPPTLAPVVPPDPSTGSTGTSTTHSPPADAGSGPGDGSGGPSGGSGDPGSSGHAGSSDPAGSGGPTSGSAGSSGSATP
jgi:hypothetical protein